jgi:hypothetical protein
MTTPNPLLDVFRRGDVARDVRLLAAEGGLEARPQEQLAILAHLTEDPDAEIRDAAEATLRRVPTPALAAFLARSSTPGSLRDFFAARGIAPAAAPSAEASDEPPLVSRSGDPDVEAWEREEADGARLPDDERKQSVVQRLASMSFTDRLKAAVKGTREMRGILIRDPNKMIAMAVLSSPKVNESEIEGYARAANVSEDVLRVIASNRAWTKNYGVLVALTRNPKTPLALSLNMMNRLNDRDLGTLSIDRNVPEPLRIAARKKVVASRG